MGLIIDGKQSACNAGDRGSGRSPGEGNGTQLQSSCLENSMDLYVRGIAESGTTERLTHTPIIARNMCVCTQLLQSRLTPCNPKDCSPPGSSVHGIFQARILEWVAMPFSRGSSQPRD